MCKRGDIILVSHYEEHGRTLPRHTFIVINDDGGEVQGVSFDLVGLVMSSLKSKEQTKRKLSYPGNLPIAATEQNITNSNYGNNKDGYIKCEQLYYFKKDQLDYTVIGYVDDEIMSIIEEYINELIDNAVEFTQNIENLPKE